MPPTRNPYRRVQADGTLVDEPLSLEAEQWAAGWADWEEDFEKDDLDEVTPTDFKYVGVRRPKPRVEEDD